MTRTALLLALLCLLTRTANADEKRTGLVGGVDLGVGTFFTTGEPAQASDSYRGPAIGADLGWMISPHFALLVDVAVATHVEDGAIASHTTLALSLQRFRTDHLWARLGVGVTRLAVHDGGGGEPERDLVRLGPALAGALGYDFDLGGSSLTLEVRTNISRLDDRTGWNLSCGLGWRWD